MAAEGSQRFGHLEVEKDRVAVGTMNCQNACLGQRRQGRPCRRKRDHISTCLTLIHGTPTARVDTAISDNRGAAPLLLQFLKHRRAGILIHQRELETSRIVRGIGLLDSASDHAKSRVRNQKFWSLRHLDVIDRRPPQRHRGRETSGLKRNFSTEIVYWPGSRSTKKKELLARDATFWPSTLMSATPPMVTVLRRK